MAKLVSQMLSAIGAVVDQSTDLPTGDELTTRISYLEDANQEWAGAYEWKQLVKSLTVGASGASAALPTNFVKFKSPLYDTTNDYEYLEIDPAERYTKDSADKYVCVMGNAVDGLYLIINPTSSNTLSFDYQFAPTSLASTTDYTICPNPTFLEQRVVERILFSRSDPRFPQEDGKAQKTLMDMITSQDVGSGAKTNSIPSFVNGRNYIIGE